MVAGAVEVTEAEDWDVLQRTLVVTPKGEEAILWDAQWAAALKRGRKIAKWINGIRRKQAH